MSILDKAIAAITPPVSEHKRQEARDKARASAEPGDWLSQILDHHEQIEAAFAEVKAASTASARRAAQKRLGVLLNGHSMAEEAVLYPALAQADKLGQAMRGKTTEALGAAFESHAVWAEPVLKDGSIWLHDDGLASSGTVVSWRDRKYGDVKMLGAMFHLSHAPRQENHAVPALGADTAAILEELGYAAAQIQDYFNRKIVA